MIYDVILGILLTLMVLVALYLVKVEHVSLLDTIGYFLDFCDAVWGYFNKRYHIWCLRQTRYPLGQDSKPFENRVAQQHLFKYFKYISCYLYDVDITALKFKLHGITAEYKDNPTDLRPLLESLLQDFFIEWWGNSSFPSVYLLNIQEGEATFLVANNAYGNEKIGQIREADRLKGAPNMDALEDE